MRGGQLHWTGDPAGSAAATAATLCAYALIHRKAPEVDPRLEPQMHQGLSWLADNVNPDGGWGETNLSPSDLPTTALVWAAWGALPEAASNYVPIVNRAEQWLRRRAPSLEPRELAGAILHDLAGNPKSAARVLAVCTLSGRLGTGPEAGQHIPVLPFARTALSHRWAALPGLHVAPHERAEYIGIGQARFHLSRPANPVRRALCAWAEPQTRELIVADQSTTGGWADSIPLTAFLVLCLASTEHGREPAALKGLGYLADHARPDGSWPSQPGRCVHVTTLALNALATGPATATTNTDLDPASRVALGEWLVARQHPDGAWSQTNRPGGLHDSGSTAEALIALHHLAPPNASSRAAAIRAAGWLAARQLPAGGLATLEHAHPHTATGDADLAATARALLAWQIWSHEWPESSRGRMALASAKALGFVRQQEGAQGTWTSPWFANHQGPDEANPTCTTATVVTSLVASELETHPEFELPLMRALLWLQRAQRRDGSWSGSLSGVHSVEETAKAVEALAAAVGSRVISESVRHAAARAAEAGAAWLCDMLRNDAWKEPAPIGRAFSGHWYYERLYPQIFTVAALGRAASLHASH